MTQADLFDVCARKHGGVATSVEANKILNKESDRQTILKALAHPAYKSRGMTLDQVCHLLECPPNAISGRFTELAAKGQIVRTSERRPTRSGATAFVWKLKS